MLHGTWLFRLRVEEEDDIDQVSSQPLSMSSPLSSLHRYSAASTKEGTLCSGMTRLVCAVVGCPTCLAAKLVFLLLFGEVKGLRPPGRPRSSFNDVTLRNCQNGHISRPYRVAQDRLLRLVLHIPSSA
jgi:hypothetical protein